MSKPGLLPVARAGGTAHKALGVLADEGMVVVPGVGCPGGQAQELGPGPPTSRRSSRRQAASPTAAKRTVGPLINPDQQRHHSLVHKERSGEGWLARLRSSRQAALGTSDVETEQSLQTGDV